MCVDVAPSFCYDNDGNNTEPSPVLRSSATYSSDGNLLISTTDALAKVTTYGYNENTGVLEWVQYPEDTETTRTEYTYDSMYRMATAACTTDSNLNLSARYTYTGDYLTTIQTPTTTYNFTYGAFGLRESVSIGEQDLATYTYTNDRNKYLQSLDYGNGDRVEYSYDKKGRLLTQTYEDGDTVSYSYDNNGALATVKDSATGRTTTYYYDLTDRMMKHTEKGTDYSHSVGYEYDSKNNLTQQVETINGTEHTTAYTYDDDNRVKTVTTDGVTVEYFYDTYSRVERQETRNGSTEILTESFTYVAPTATATSTQIATHTVTAGSSETVYNYTYDDNGNILSVNTLINTLSCDSDGEIQRTCVQDNTVSYRYDSANQLIAEYNIKEASGYIWGYDAAGNITYSHPCDYFEDEDSLVPLAERFYYYEDESWDDLLTNYDGQTIVRDDIGNPLSYDGWTYTWEHGRQLASMSDGTTTWTYTYNADGLRIAKTNGIDTWNYVYNGSLLTQQTKGDDTLYFSYDAGGTPLTVKYNGTTYYYATNIQGDVVAILNSSGTAVVTYSYNAWGKSWGRTGSMKDTLGILNPLRYRGYVYDEETGLYYLQSRYYDPEIGRFINADNQFSIGDITGMNLFAYCGNNPINRIDPTGEAWGHWVLGAIVVAACAAATVITCGGFAAAATAVCLVGNGIAAATTASTVAAAAFIGSATAYGTAVIAAVSNSNSADDFAAQGNWGTVVDTIGGGMLEGYLAYSPTNVAKSKIVPNPNGKKGGPAHQNEIARQVAIYNQPGYTVRTEVKINTPGGAKPYRYADFSVTNNLTGDVWYGNVGLQLKSGLPCARERSAISDIQNAGCTIRFFPYN